MREEKETTFSHHQPQELTVRESGVAPYMGNGGLGHPDDGALFQQRMQELLHRLWDAHGAWRLQVLPCASNAACVFFGQSLDNHHPELVIYDFAPEGDSMAQSLSIVNEHNKCSVKPA